MSMDELESDRQQNNERDSFFSPVVIRGHEVPTDFTDEDILFAQELDELYAPDQEVLPPFFVQTLLESDDPRFQSVERGFEHKTRARVFRQLKLRRRLFQLERPTLRSILVPLPVRRSLVTSAAVMLFLFLTAMFTAPSFAAGMQILLRGGHTGVLLSRTFPNGVYSSTTKNTSALGSFALQDSDLQTKFSLQDAQQQLHSWQMFSPQSIPDNYVLSNIYLYQQQQQNWADGPFVEFDYSLVGKSPLGSGVLAIREFKLKPNVSVLQVVKDGAAQSINIDQTGQAQAIYVDGQWVMYDKTRPVWHSGSRSELIFQKDGIVIWIVGDQRDGVDEKSLLTIANSLQTLRVDRIIHTSAYSSMKTVTQLDGDVNGPFTGDILAVFPDGTIGGSYMTLIGSDQSVPDKSASKYQHQYVR